MHPAHLAMLAAYGHPVLADHSFAAHMQAQAHQQALMAGQEAQQFASIAGGAEIYGAAAYGNDLEGLLAMAGAEIYGAPAYGAAAYGSGAEIYGAAPASLSLPPWMLANQGHRSMAPHHAPAFARGVDVQVKPGTNARRFPLGFGPQSVATLTTVTITTRPQCYYRPEKLVIPSDFAGNFQINDLKVGKDSQFVASNPLPARAFTETSVDNLLQFHGAAIAQDISVVAQNNAGIAQTFFAYMAGTAVE